MTQTTAPVTIVFTDIEGSTHLWETSPASMRDAHARHNEIVVDVFTEAGGSILKDKGDGFIAIFPNPVAAVLAAAGAQRALATTEWPAEVGELRVRMAINTGVVESRNGDYYGPEMNRAARLEAIGHGGQILVSETTRSLTTGRLDGLNLIDLGHHQLRGIDQPERVFQVGGEGLHNDFPALRSISRGHALPVFATTFVGRTSERSEIVGLIRDGARLVTLLGPGGIGKTRLAVEAAREIDPTMSGRTYFADLAPLASADQVGTAVAEAVGVHPEGRADVLTLVADAITAPALLVVDNLEHVISAGPALGDLISNSPTLTILATSRQPLALSAERVYRVSPLALASNGSPSPAVQLFYDRAAAQGVHLTEDDLPAVASICQRLDGIPLAIELVAPRSRMMSAAELDEMLARSLDALSTGAADMPERHRTIRSAIDWSLQSLTASQRGLFTRLAVLPAGATYPMLQQICASEPGGDLMDDLTVLVDNSLVNSVTGLPGGTRFRQLAPLREYGLELLRAQDEYTATMDRLVDYYLATSPEWGRRLRSDARTEHELEVDHSNLLSALDWSLQSGRAEPMSRAQVEMWFYWFKGDRIAGAVDWVRRARGTNASASLDFLAGLFAFQTRDFDTLVEVLPRALQGFRDEDDTYGLALALTFGSLGVEDPDHGYLMLEEAEGLVGDSDPGLRMIMLLFESMIDTQCGRPDEALRHREEVLAIAHRTELPEMTAWAKWNLGWTHLAMGDDAKSATLWAEAFDYMAGARYQEGVASTAEAIAMCEIGAGRPERAAKLLGGSAITFERIGTVPWIEAGIVVEGALVGLREELGDAEFEHHFGEGREMGLDQLIALTSEAIDDLNAG